MVLTRLTIENVRNLVSTADIFPAGGINLFYGDNGAGKTSILESISILAQGRSFRTNNIAEVTHFNQRFCRVFATLEYKKQKHHLGIQRDREKTTIRIDGETIHSLSKLSEFIPLITLHPGSFTLLIGPPSFRRASLDWGIFFADQRFHQSWKNYRHALKQRNMALRSQRPVKEILSWNWVLASEGEFLTRARTQYLNALIENCNELVEGFARNYQFEGKYLQGWDKSLPLAEALDRNLSRDLTLSYTSIGAHRCDFKLYLNDKPVSSFASRGQTKLLTVLLKLAQAKIYTQQHNEPCILLLDDFASEFDKEHLEKIIAIIQRLELQTFVTSVESTSTLKPHIEKMFHVKHGEVREVI